MIDLKQATHSSRGDEFDRDEANWPGALLRGASGERSSG
jgi:hypothetical protein